ncbi:MAG: ATP-binding protein [Candidatus Limnocylindria bacterium]
MIGIALGRRAVVGAVIGLAAAAGGLVVALLAREIATPPVLVLISVMATGLALGSGAAAGAFVAGSALALTAAAVRGAGVVAPLPMAIELVGAPVIVALIVRHERVRAEALAARDASLAAEQHARDERAELERIREAADAALADAERERARLEEVAESIPEPLIVYDAELRGTYGNRAALRLFGRRFVERSVEEWGRSTEPRNERGVAVPMREWPQVRAQREPIRQRLTLRQPMSGRDLLVDVEGTPIPGGGCVLLLRDVGKEEEERRRLSQFASFVAHELRNPLAVAKARTELNQRDETLDARTRTHAERALESIDSAIAILERLELFSRAESGNIEARREPFSLDRALRSATERLRARGCERPIRVRVPAGLMPIGDLHLTEQAITNLLTNSDRYSTPGGAITIEASTEDAVELRVTDAGPGLDDAVADTIFRERVTSGMGLGLGLYLVRTTMEAQGGSVTLEQRKPNPVFVLRWPRQAETQLGEEEGAA